MVAISADGNTAGVGGPNDDGAIGAVWIFTRGNGTWSPKGPKLVGTGWTQHPYQGQTVALSADGNTLVEGGPGDNGGNGALWVFTRSNGTWSQQGNKLVPFDTAGQPNLGTSVALSADGNTAIAGGPNDFCYSSTSCWGGAWTFTRSNGHWSQGVKLTGDVQLYSPGPLQGESVAISADGNTALVGGPNDLDGKGNKIGGAWVWTRNSSDGWSQQELIGTNDQAGTDIEQGWGVALSADGSTAAVGGPQAYGGHGAVWVYSRVNGVWRQQGLELAGTGLLGPSFQGGQDGVALSADGNTLISGGSGDNPLSGGSTYGAVWVFQRSNGTWTQHGSKLIGSGSTGAASQGFSVALSGDGSTLIEGGASDNANQGAAWVFVQPRANHFSVSAPASTSAGTPFNFTVTALDPNNSVVPGYSGTVHFSSTDSTAILPGNVTLTSGTGTFSATLNAGVSQTITATDTALSSITGTSGAIAVGSATVSMAPGAVTPGYGSGMSQMMSFTFSDPRGVHDLDVVNVLINNFLDGRSACYLAYSNSGSMLYLVADNGGTLLPLALNGSGTVSNSQCTVTGAGSSATGSGNTLTLTLNLSFNPAFAGDKVFYMAAHDLQGGNSGWQALGTWCVPGASTFPAVTAAAPARGAGSSQAFTFTFTDTKGFQDLGVANVLINSALDGRQACYIAYSQPYRTLYLVGDAGGGLSQGLALGGSGSVSNSHCTIKCGRLFGHLQREHHDAGAEHEFHRLVRRQPGDLCGRPRHYRSQQFGLAGHGFVDRAIARRRKEGSPPDDKKPGWRPASLVCGLVKSRDTGAVCLVRDEVRV
ncbi:MAG TPA: hypothetical protein VE959_00355 [Bryobacteraceae bacterium]|nr:hypothetical protein [Bryobacteraceae bacterium]